jgi:hypothetical protein
MKGFDRLLQDQARFDPVSLTERRLSLKAEENNSGRWMGGFGQNLPNSSRHEFWVVVGQAPGKFRKLGNESAKRRRAVGVDPDPRTDPPRVFPATGPPEPTAVRWQSAGKQLSLGQFQRDQP